MPLTSGPVKSGSLQSTPYEEIDAGKPPIPITVAPTPSSAQLELHPSLRPDANTETNEGGAKAAAHHNLSEEDGRRDSGLAPSQSTARDSHTPPVTETDAASVSKPPRPPPSGMSKSLGPSSSPTGGRHRLSKVKPTPRIVPSGRVSSTEIPETSFQGICTEIPTSTFEEFTSPNNMQFSKRGSVLLGGRRVSEANTKSQGNPSSPADAQNDLPVPGPSRRILSHDEETLSRRVRSMYEGELSSSVLSQLAADRHSTSAATPAPIPEQLSTEVEPLPKILENSRDRGGDSNSQTSPTLATKLLAGGIEDWEDVDSRDVDRYGFIVPRPLMPNASSSSLPTTPAVKLHRVSTALQLRSEEPRRRYSRLGRSPSMTKSTRSAGNVARPASSQSSYRTTRSTRSSRLRTATNRLPHNRSRRLVDEAGDMLTLPPGLADIAEHEDSIRGPDVQRKKEWEREAKWRKMAKLEKAKGAGGGMVFSFDTTSQKLIDRTWKGIPDRWRATAWHSFLAASAKKTPGSLSDEDLKSSFYELLDQSSPDDVQIDLDVPRTISSHIMFRKRYRGGQRLLFRVLHSLSLHFPDTGYVQGMAALAATLLCYYDEEMAFVMLVRMWQLRGLERLYKAGFEGLMQALEEFETNWLSDGDVGSKLRELGITSTSYGTRWYLTVFNYSIPFPAQLRVWDVFLLLGEENSSRRSGDKFPFSGQLDVLHATSAALIDATREILLDSDFENAMKVLTSWIPVKDEDMLLDVAKTEWRAFTKKRR